MSNIAISLRRLLAVTTAIGLALPAYAQDDNAAPPPGRVGQIAGITGSVSYNGAGSNGQWVAATPNYPVSTGDSLFTQNNAQASVALDSSRLTLGPNTELQITALDNNNFTATESQGEVFLTLADLQPGQIFTLMTPRGSVNIAQSGEYDVTAGDANTPTTVAVITGSATVGQLQIPAGQEGYLSGTDQTTAQLGAIQRDDFMTHALAQLAPPPPPYAPPVVQQMTGVSELSNYGTWDQSPQYGAVWYPSVNAGWAPYREGHWAFVAPWGWTWVDAAPWGFAPFHYGRWIDGGGRWGWVPAAAYAGGGYGPDYQPVYAPAVVGFFGLGAGIAITAAILSSGSVGWVPLGPNEAYHPYYHASDDYFHRINRADVRNYNQIDIHNTTIINNYANRRAATYIPAGAMARGEAVGHYGHAVPENMFAQAHPVQGNFNQALRPDITHRDAAAPRPSEFAQRHDVPRAVISHEPAQPGFHPQNAVSHSQFPGANGGIQHPGNAFHPENTAQGQQFRPQATAPQHTEHLPQTIRPQEPSQPFRQPEQTRPRAPQQHEQPMPQIIRPQEQNQPFHTQEQTRPPQQFHPQEQSRPQPQQFHPQEQFHPQQQARPEAPRPQENRPQENHPQGGNHEGGHDNNHQHP